MRNTFQQALERHHSAFDLVLSSEQIERLACFYDLIQEHNPLLHLVAPSSAEEFAVRHILESLKLLEHLPRGAKFADIGTGGGFPAIPCLLVRDDLRTLLIESKLKKANFLSHATDALGLNDRTKVVNKQFLETEPGDCEFVTCRALERFIERLPKILKWAAPRGLLLFGGPNLSEALRKNNIEFESLLMPLSERRYLFVAKRRPR